MDLNKEIDNKEKAQDILNLCQQSKFTISDIKKKTSIRKPQQPFITSTLQQESSNKFKMSPKITMKVAQTLYESVPYAFFTRLFHTPFHTPFSHAFLHTPFSYAFFHTPFHTPFSSSS